MTELKGNETLTRGPDIADYIRIARFDHWVKNIFVLPGMTCALLLQPNATRFEFGAFITALLATGFVASANYVLNEYLDAEFDRHHPLKTMRPGAQGRLDIHYVTIEYLLLAGLGLGLAATLNSAFLITAGALLVMGLIYNVPPVRSKDRVFLDVLSEAINNPIRFLLGWYAFGAVGLPPSSVLLAYWMGGAYLMAIKRYAEYRQIGDPARAGLYRRSFRAYTESRLLLSSFFYALNAVLFLGIFLVKYRVEYILTFPLIAALFVIYMYLGSKDRSTAAAPERLYRESGLMLLTGVLAIAIAALTFIDIPGLHFIMEPVRY